MQAVLELSRILCQLLLVIDVNALGATMGAVRHAVLAAPVRLRSVMCADLYACIRDSDDYVRKHRLAKWYQLLVAEVMTDRISDSESASQTISTA